MTVVAEDLQKWMFEETAAEALLAVHEEDGVVGCAVFHRTFPTWAGKPGMHLEDLYVRPEHRKQGVAQHLMSRLAAVCEERGWVRIDWLCGAANESGQSFYRSIGATRQDTIVPLRVRGEELHELAGKNC